MKALALACISLLGSSSAVPVQAASRMRSQQAASAQYALHDLSRPGGATSATARAINGDGIVVGNAVVHSHATSEMWRLGSSGAEKGRVDIAPPAGYADSELVAINDNGAAVGTVYAAPGSSGVASGYPAYYRGSSWTVLRWHPSEQGTGDAIASNGVISASFWDPSLNQFVAATVSPSAHGAYHGYHTLPLARSGRGSEGNAVLSLKGTVLVGGYEDTPAPHDEVAQQAVIWVNGKGPYTVDTSKLGFNQPGTGVTSMYGYEPSQISAVGYGYENVDGISWTEPWVVHINAAGTKPVIGRPVALPVPGYASFGYAATIGASPDGQKGEFSIGGNASDLAGATSAVLWMLDTSGNKLSVQSFTDLSTLATPAELSCPVYEVESVDTRGNAAGYAFCNGRVRPATIYATVHEPQGIHTSNSSRVDRFSEPSAPDSVSRPVALLTCGLRCFHQGSCAQPIQAPPREFSCPPQG